MTPAAVRKWAALAVFVLQNAGVVLLMRYSRVMPGTAYSSRIAVLMQELTKLPICSLLFMLESGGPLKGIAALVRDLQNNWMEWLKLGVPALLYTVQNNALFLGLSNLEAAVAHVTYQTKILFTALFSICLLGKKLGKAQWLGLSCLVLGVICVQGLFDQLYNKMHSANAHARDHPHHGRSLASESSKTAVGLTAMITAAVCTSFASVYFEKMLKGARKPSLWLRNIQLASYSAVIATATVLAEDDPLRASEGWLHGFNGITWCVVGLNVAGGLLVAVTIKYADNIIRGFAQAVAIIFGALGSYFIFDFHITTSFLVGVMLVILAILFYGGAISPTELCEAIAGACLPKTHQAEKSKLLATQEEDLSQSADASCGEIDPRRRTPALQV